MSTYTWGGLFDFTRRQGAASVQASAKDALLICQMVSQRMYVYAPWEFTLKTTKPGQIPCVDGMQDYAAPADCYRLVKAWMFYTVPNGVSQTHPVDVVKNLDVNLNPVGWLGAWQIAQLGNSGMWRLNAATAVPDTQNFEIQAQYQPFHKQFQDVNQLVWFADEYVDMAQAGLQYYLYQFNNDPRAGVASVDPSGNVAYSGQLAVWQGMMANAAGEERRGSVDAFLPVMSLGVDYGGGMWP